MKAYQIVLLLIAALVLNNLALLTFIGHFSEDDTSPIGVIKSDAGVAVEPQETAISEAVPRQTSKAAETPQPLNQIELTQVIDNYISSDQFSVALDDWQLKSVQRSEEIESRLIKMDALELYSLTREGRSHTERVMAFQQLILSSKLKKLSNEQLRELYSDNGRGQWGKVKLLNVLLERDDPYALTIAKQTISDGSVTNRYSGSDFYTAIYEKDPEFMRRHIAEVGFDESSTAYGLLSFMRQEPDLAGSYLSQNFDEIINSDNEEVFAIGVSGINIEISDYQRSKIAELFDSKNRRKRNFAIGLARNIKDTQTLRDAYEKLSRRGEKTQFLAGLLYPEVNPEVTALVKEIASSSDDLNIRRLANSR